MICGSVPFKGRSMKELHERIRARAFEYPVAISPSARELIEGLLVPDPQRRMTLPEVLGSRWMRGPESVGPWMGREDCEAGRNGEIDLGNLFFRDGRLAYSDYCSIANDFYTHNISTGLPSNHGDRRGGATKTGETRVPARTGDSWPGKLRPQPRHCRLQLISFMIIFSLTIVSA